MNKIKDSIVAQGGSEISDSKIIKSKFDKPSFWKGFISGIISSIIAALIYDFIRNYF